MDALGAILLIAWIVFSAIRKKQKREAAEAAKRAAIEQATQQGSAPAAPHYDAPVRHAVEPAPQPAAPKPQPAFDPFFGGLMEALNELDKAQQPAKAPAPPQQPAKAPALQDKPRPAAHTSVTTEGPQQRVGSRLSDRSATMQTTLRHALEASSISGHAHTESSITGVEAECAPEMPARASASSTAAPASAFTWDVNDAMRGLVLSEILGRPKALQQ